MMVFMPDAHTLLTMVHGTESGSPANKAACLSGAWPIPAGKTDPMYTSSTASLSQFARFSASCMARAPNLGAGMDANVPLKEPIGVRAAPTITTSCSLRCVTFQERLVLSFKQSERLTIFPKRQNPDMVGLF